MSGLPKHAKFYVVPAGTRTGQCRGADCKAVIYFIDHPTTGRPFPVDCDVEGGETPSEHVNDPNQQGLFSDGGEQHHDGRGVSHFFTCPNADDFGKGKR